MPVSISLGLFSSVLNLFAVACISTSAVCSFALKNFVMSHFGLNDFNTAPTNPLPCASTLFHSM